MTNRKQELEKTIQSARAELWEIERAEALQSNKAHVGKFFKCQNCYSCPQDASDYWWLYVAVIGVEEGELRVHRFQRDKYGKIEIEPKTLIPHLTGGYKEITELEYAKAWAGIQDVISEVSI